MEFTTVAVFAVLLCSGTPLSAQGSPSSDEAKKQSDCRLADQVVMTGHPAPHREWAYTILLECREAGPAAIAAMWTSARRPAGDEFPFLIRATHQMRDRRVYSALRSVGESASEDVDTRLHALALLIVYASPVPLIFEPADFRLPPDGPRAADEGPWPF